MQTLLSLTADRHAAPGPALAYLPTLQFMRRFSAYEWAWELEFDTRYIGHWGR